MKKNSLVKVLGEVQTHLTDTKARSEHQHNSVLQV